MPDVHVSTADPLGIGTLDGSNYINVADITGGPRNDYHEVLAGNGKYISAAVKALRPVEEWTIVYELLDSASFTLAFGVPVNTDYLVTAFNCNTNADGRPTVNVTVVKPSAAAKIKSYVGSAVSVTITGGFGIVEKWGATAAANMISTQANISMQTLEALEETSGDYMTAGIYHFGFKREIAIEAYGAITLPGTGHLVSEDKRESREGWQIYAKNFWAYEDAA